MSWSVVSTVAGPAWLIHLHARYLKNLGAHEVVYFLDLPHLYCDSEIKELQKIATIVLCDNSYWSELGNKPNNLPRRQVKNIENSKKIIHGDWIFHIDLDEFPYFNRNINDLLSCFPQSVKAIRVQNFERVLLTGSDSWFDGFLRVPQFDSDILAIYGRRGRYLKNGLSAYVHGKSFVRNDKSINQGVHGVEIPGRTIDYTDFQLGYFDGFLIHYECFSPFSWIRKIFNRAKTRIENTGQRFFSHEIRLIEDFSKSADMMRRAEELLYLLHFASREDAAQWCDSGLARHMPADIGVKFGNAATLPMHLNMDFLDIEMARFFRVR